jgi:tetratricopeptide (TPR) repeat protein
MPRRHGPAKYCIIAVMNRSIAITISLCLAAGLLLFPASASAGSLDISVPLLVDLKEIMPFLEESAGKTPDNAGFHTALGGIYINIGTLDPERESGQEYDPPEFRLAGNHLKKAMKLAPSMALPYYYMGLLEIHRQNHDEALGYFESALELSPRDVRVHQQIHTLHFAARKYATAALFLENSIKSIPDEANLYHRLAASYLAINDLSKAAQHARKAMGLEYDPETNNLLATIYMKGGRFELAEPEFRKVLKRSPQNINAMLGIARTLEHRGKSKEAKRWIGEILSLDNENAEALMILKEIQETRRKRQ